MVNVLRRDYDCIPFFLSQDPIKPPQLAARKPIKITGKSNFKKEAILPENAMLKPMRIIIGPAIQKPQRQDFLGQTNPKARPARNKTIPTMV